MKRLRLDFADEGGRGRLGAVFLCLLALASVAHTVYRYASLREQIEFWNGERWRAQQAARMREQEEGAPTPAQREQAAAEAQAARRVLARLQLPWDALFRDIEASVFEHVALLGLEPDAEKGEIRISAEARDFAAMLEYQKRLADLPSLAQPYILSHQVQKQEAQQPVRFVILARWEQGGKPGPAVPSHGG